MRIKPVTQIGANRPLCAVVIRVAEGLATTAAQRGLYQRKRLGIPVDQCGKRSDFMVDGVPTCRAHAGAAALAHTIEASRVPTDQEEIDRPRCGCPRATLERVILRNGTCSKGGCPYDGDV